MSIYGKDTRQLAALFGQREQTGKADIERHDVDKLQLCLCFCGRGGKATGTVVLPEGLRGTFRWNGRDVALGPDSNLLD